MLAVVLYIMAVGLYELFIDDNLDLPAWLVIHNLEDLKEKLVGVVIVVLAVFFLGRVIESQEPLEVLYLGVGISAVIAALSYFSSRVLEGIRSSRDRSLTLECVAAHTYARRVTTSHHSRSISRSISRSRRSSHDPGASAKALSERSRRDREVGRREHPGPA